MLETLVIRNIVLIDTLQIDFREGLCVLTGETGAGKSILLDALGLALGARAEARLLRQGAEQASVTALFQLPSSHAIWEELTLQEVTHDKASLLFRRTLKADGKSQCFLNDQLISQPLMRRFGQVLVEIHGQFDTLLEPKSQLLALDAYGKVDMTSTQRAFKNYQDANAALEAFEKKLAHSAERQAFLHFAIKEIEQLSPQHGEMAHLEQEKSLIAHGAKLSEALHFVEQALTPLITPLSQSHKSLDRIQSYLPEKISPLLEATDRALLDVQDIVESVTTLKRDTAEAAHTLEKVEDRLHGLRALSRKYLCEDLADCLLHFKTELASFEQGEDHKYLLEATLQEKKTSYLEVARQLSAQRQAAAHSLEMALTGEFHPLKLTHARFRVHLAELSEESWRETGIDRIEFYIQTNPDTPEGPLNTIASGGERARFMLALKGILAQSGTVSTLIFDEIESGTGGAVASAMGERLKKLSQQMQVLAITHSPQIAAQGTQHLLVFKKVVEGRTITELRSLEGHERHEEVARMLAGHDVTDEARAAAMRLMA